MGVDRGRALKGRTRGEKWLVFGFVVVGVCSRVGLVAFARCGVFLGRCGCGVLGWLVWLWYARLWGHVVGLLPM